MESINWEWPPIGFYYAHTLTRETRNVFVPIPAINSFEKFSQGV